MRGSDRRQFWTLNIAAVSVIAVVVVSFIGYKTVHPTFDSSSTIHVGVDVPSVAPGVHAGTKVILRGNEIGRITALTRRADNTLRMDLSLHSDEAHGLTDAMDIDFRPENYFGVTAVNLVKKSGGENLASGQVMDRTNAGDYTMSTMLEKGSIDIDGSLTNSMIETLDKVIRYTDGLTPMIQAGIVFADRVAKTQRAIPSVLLGDLNNTLEVLPGFSRQSIEALYDLYDNNTNHLPDGTWGRDDAFWSDLNAAMDAGMNGLFGAAGSLLKTHDTQLTPATHLPAAIFGAMPTLMANGQGPSKVSALVDRYSTVFTGPDHGKTLNMKLIVDTLPAVTTPLALTGLPTPPHQGAPR
ncbi:MAG: Mce family protein [Nocardia sp.]|nr:Mce family protein [Nocardia sp.]